MQRGGDPIILCFVDFANPACAATAMNALQGICLSPSLSLTHTKLQQDNIELFLLG